MILSLIALPDPAQQWFAATKYKGKQDVWRSTLNTVK